MESDGASGEGVGEGLEDLAIESVESEFIDPEGSENLLARDGIRDIVPNHLIISEDFDETIDDTRRPTAFLGDEHMDSWSRDDDSEESKRSRDDRLEIDEFVEVEFEDISESIPEWSGDLREFGRRTDEGKLGDIHFDGCRARPRSNHDIDREIFHRTIENLLNLRFEAMNLIDEKHISFFEAREE